MGPEHVPVDAYRLLRQIAVNGNRLRLPAANPDSDAAVGFLLNRGLAVKVDEAYLSATDEGLSVGRLMRAAP